MKTMLRVATYTKQYRRATSNQAVYSSFAMQRVRRRVLGVVSEPTLVFLGVADFPRCLHQVLLVDIISVGTMSIITSFSCEEDLPLVPDSEHSSFCDNVTKIGAVETIG